MANDADNDREFDRTTKILNTIYGRYITHILYSAIGSGAVVGVFASLSKEGGAGFYKPDVLFQSPVIIILIFAVPILTISWGAGFVYLNVEMWAHRHYLASLEKQRNKENKSHRIGLYSTALWETLYEGGRRQRFPGLSYTTYLTILVALFPAVVGLASMYYGMAYIYERFAAFHNWKHCLKISVPMLYGIVVLFFYGWVFYLKEKIGKRLQRILELEDAA